MPAHRLGMSPTDAPADLLPERILPGPGLAAAGMSVPSYSTLYRRGQLPPEFFSHVERSRRLLSREGFLALAAYRAVVERRVEIGELPPAAFLRWASLWLRGVPVRELWVRYYGRAGDPDSRVSVLPNDDLLPEPAAAGALLSIRLDLEAIFGSAVRAYSSLAADRRDIWSELADGE